MLTFKKSLIALSIVSLSLTAVSHVYADGHAKAEDAVVATVNGAEIKQSALDGYLEILKNQKQGKAATTESALDDLMATEIAVQEAKKSDILERPATKKAISDYTRNVLLQTWTREKLASFKVDDAELKKAYDERVTALASKEFNARHILVKTEDEAKAIIKEASADGADFAAIAKDKSTGPSSSNGGSLGWFKAQTMVPAFSNAVKTMEKGDISKEPVKTQFGYHVIKLEDSRDAKLPTLESLKPQLERVVSQKSMLAYMEELKSKADIKIIQPEKAMSDKKMEGKMEDKMAGKMEDKKMEAKMDDKMADKKMEHKMDDKMKDKMEDKK